MHAKAWIARITVLGVLAVVEAPCAQGIFKCVDDASGAATTYQSVPCANGQIEKRILAVVEPPREESVNPSRPLPREESSKPMRSAPPRVPQRQAWPFQRAMVLGMSDDEVLNLPGWGRPGRIIRTRAPREWREEWIYAGSTSGERRLRFVNAALVEIVDQPASDQSAPLAHLASSETKAYQY